MTVSGVGLTRAYSAAISWDYDKPAASVCQIKMSQTLIILFGGRTQKLAYTPRLLLPNRPYSFSALNLF